MLYLTVYVLSIMTLGRGLKLLNPQAITEELPPAVFSPIKETQPEIEELKTDPFASQAQEDDKYLQEAIKNTTTRASQQ